LGDGELKLTTAAAVFVVSAALTAEIETEEVGEVAGTVYRPEVEIVPRLALPQAMPFTNHVTAALFVPLTIALNAWL